MVEEFIGSQGPHRMEGKGGFKDEEEEEAE